MTIFISKNNNNNDNILLTISNFMVQLQRYNVNLILFICIIALFCTINEKNMCNNGNFHEINNNNNI